VVLGVVVVGAAGTVVVVVGAATVVVVVAGVVVVGVVVVVVVGCLLFFFGATVVVVVDVEVLDGTSEYVGGAACNSGERSPWVTVTSVPMGSIGNTFAAFAIGISTHPALCGNP
jgi:hypothetical protein